MQQSFFTSLILCSLLLPATAFAQGQAIDGNIEGSVRASSGSYLPQVRVRARNLQTGFERETLTTDQGTYTIQLLPPGKYNLLAALAGFETVVRPEVEIKAGQVLTVPFTLAPSAVATEIQVTAAVPVVEAGRTVISNTQEEAIVRNVPTIGRSIQDFYTLQPGVLARPLSTGGSGTGTATTVYGGLGLRQINVDGVTNQLQGGARNIVISQEAIQEFQTVTNFSPEFGRVGGGLQNAFTRSGSNELHASAFLFARHKVLSAKPQLLRDDQPQPDFARYNFGGTIAGAFAKDKLFFFGTYERWYQDLPQVLTITPANAALLSIPPSSIGVSTSGFRAHTTTYKMDWLINQKHRLSLRHNYYFDRESPLGSGLVSAETLSRFDEDPFAATGQLVSSFSPSLTNEFRFLFANRPISNGVPNGDAPNINVQGIAGFNGNSNGNRTTNEQGFQIINNTTFIQGRHTYKVGVDILPVNFKERLTNVNGQFVFGGLPAVPGVRGAVSAIDQFLNTERRLIDPSTNQPFSYTRFTQSVGREFYDATVINQGYFFQDDYRVSPRLKLSYGIRYELFLRPNAIPNPDLPATANFNQDTNNWAPRVGLAWDLTGDGKTVLRTGFGIYYNTTVAQTWNNFFRGNGVEVLNLNVTPADPGAPAFTRGRVSPLTGARRPVTDVRALSPEFGDVTTYNYFATFEREIIPNLGLSLTYQGTSGRDLPVSLNSNLRNTGTILADGRPLWSTTNRPDARFGNIFTSESIGSSNYNGLVAVLSKRYSRGVSLQASYQVSKSNGFFFADDFTGFGIFTSPTDPRTLSYDGGPGDFDMRHRFLLTGTWEPELKGATPQLRAIVNGWMLSSRVIAQSGFSFNATTGRDENGDTVLNDRPVGFPYNAFKLPKYNTVDFRITRNFLIRDRNRIEVIGEVFNVANTVNVTNVNRVWGFNPTPNASFNTPTAAENARQFQLAIRWSY
jgi:hypothetical protein